MMVTPVLLCSCLLLSVQLPAGLQDLWARAIGDGGRHVRNDEEQPMVSIRRGAASAAQLTQFEALANSAQQTAPHAFVRASRNFGAGKPHNTGHSVTFLHHSSSDAAALPFVQLYSCCKQEMGNGQTRFVIIPVL